MQTVHDGRQFMKYIDPKLGVPLPERDYGGNCLMYDPGNTTDPFHNIWVRRCCHLLLKRRRTWISYSVAAFYPPHPPPFHLFVYLSCKHTQTVSVWLRAGWFQKLVSDADQIPSVEPGLLPPPHSPHGCKKKKYILYNEVHLPYIEL